MRVWMLCLLVGGCATAGPYRVTPVTENVNAGVEAVSLDIRDGKCVLTVGIKGAGRGELSAPAQWCHDAKVAKGAAK